MFIHNTKVELRIYSIQFSPNDVEQIITQLKERVSCYIEYSESGGCGIWNITPESYHQIDEILENIRSIEI